MLIVLASWVALYGPQSTILRCPFKGASWSIRCLHWSCGIYGDTASAEVMALILVALRRAAVWKEDVKEASLCLYMDFPPSPTVNQSCQCGTIRSPPRCYEVPGEVVASSCLQRLSNMRLIIHIAPPTPFQIKHTLDLIQMKASVHIRYTHRDR